MRIILLQIMVFLVLSSAATAVVETYHFDDEVLRERYLSFIDELRCPKCQNQNLSGSNSPIAEDLRKELYRLLVEGKSDTEIIHFMVSRYGEFVLYRPPFNAETALLWFAPVIFLVLGGLMVMLIVRRQKNTESEKGLVVLDVSEQQELDRLLNQSAKAGEVNKDNTDV